jgi:hypothetical protein
MSSIPPPLSFAAKVAVERVADGALREATAQCAACGAALDDVSQRFCGGDRCDRVLMRHSTFEFCNGAATLCRR